MTTNQDETAKVLRVYEKTANSYDRQMAFFEKIQFGGGREWLGRRAQGRVLEVAVGTGLNLAYYPAEVTVTGIELSPAMLAIARKRAADLGRDVDLYQGDAQQLPFADASFDTAVCAPNRFVSCWTEIMTLPYLPALPPNGDGNRNSRFRV